GRHWTSDPSKPDVRDAQDDGAFPAEICLLRNAGFKTIRMYGETAATWVAVLDAIDDYNSGKLSCTPNTPGADCHATNSCLSLVYQVAICGPDPRSLAWNGTYGSIDDVKCYDVGAAVAGESRFADTLSAELLKLRQVLGASGDKFARNVPLVFVGNEILYSRGVCGGGSNAGNACTDNSDCRGGTCHIGHYCSDQLSGATPPPQCQSSAACTGKATCTDVTNLAPLQYAFTHVQQALAKEIPAASMPAISMSLQVDLLITPSFGDDAKSAALMWSRHQLAQALPSKIIAVNTYPDQWGKVLEGQTICPGALPSCVDQTNAVNGQALL